MNQTELTTVVFNKLNNQLSKKEVEGVINTLLGTMKESLENNQKITLKGFFSIYTTLVKEKNGHSFGTDWSIPTKYVPKVKFSATFKKMLAVNTKV